MEFKHISVLLKESVDALNINPNGIYADGTLGGGGHSYEIVKNLSGGMLVGIDRDKEAICAAKKRLSEFENVLYINDNYKNIKNILKENNIDGLDGAVLDLGVSSYQLDNPERGFSYIEDAPLDMRMNADDALSAYNVINEYEKEELIRIFFEYGEEKFSRKIAENIVAARLISPIKTTAELSEIVKKSIPAKTVKKGSHPAKRVFQAVRIEVNGEIEHLENAVRDFFDVLKTGGHLAIITFHSLEDRIVKNVFASLATGCICPKEFPVCVCNNKPKGKIITRKPIIPSDKEMVENSRSKSSKLRVIEKII